MSSQTDAAQLEPFSSHLAKILMASVAPGLPFLFTFPCFQASIFIPFPSFPFSGSFLRPA